MDLTNRIFGEGEERLSGGVMEYDVEVEYLVRVFGKKFFEIGKLEEILGGNEGDRLKWQVDEVVA